MRNFHFALAFALFSFVPLACAAGHADENSVRCSTLVRDCLLASKETRGGCFLQASNHESCKGTALGALSAKRWAFTPSRSTGIETAPAFLGPQFVDQECLRRFDAELSSILIRGEPSTQSIQKLEDRISRCNNSAPSDLLRP